MGKNTRLLYYLLCVVFAFCLCTQQSPNNVGNNTSPASGTVIDIDGNVYHTDTIGTQVWMVGNLKTTHYNDGTAIPLVKDSTSWANDTTPGYCYYNNDSAKYENPYGVLYNGYAVNTGKLAPAGWHVPTDSEWNVLITYLGGKGVAGGELKEASIGHWLPPNTGATNVTGFSALPGGSRNNFSGYLSYTGIGSTGYWWSAMVLGAPYTCFYLNDNNDTVYQSSNYSYIGYPSVLNNGFSVRCVKGNPTIQAPLIIDQPQRIDTVIAGRNVTFRVDAVGTVPLTYQWEKNGNPISGQTNSSLTITNAQSSDAGTYTVCVSNSNGTGKVTSDGAVLTVNAPIAPNITVQPQSQTVTAGVQSPILIFRVTATGTAPLSYQWYKNEYSNFRSGFIELLDIECTGSRCGNIYRCGIQWFLPNATSSGAVLTVNAAPVDL